MAEITDLDELFPIGKKLKFTGHDDKQEYILDLFAPFGIILYINQLEKKGEAGDLDDATFQMNILEQFLIHQHPHMTRAWIEKNLPVQYQNKIVNMVMTAINDSTGFFQQGKGAGELREILTEVENMDQKVKQFSSGESSGT